jgi:hypothetical protein
VLVLGRSVPPSNPLNPVFWRTFASPRALSLVNAEGT